MKPLAGKTALVTGAGKGSGRGIAWALAEQGASIVVNDLRGELANAVVQELGDLGAKARPAVFDVTDYDAVQAAIGELPQPVDILVNNAGMPQQRLQAPFLESSPANWKPFIDLNLYGSMHCMRTVLPGMCERGWGRVVQISSGAAARGLPASAGYSALAASKAGIEGLVRHVALEVAGRGVTVNAVALGQMTNAVEHADPEVIALVRAQTPVGRPGEPREAGAAVVWLASDDAGFVTGQVIHVNGGSYQGR